MGLLAVSGAKPVLAQHERSCHIVVEVNPTDAGLAGKIYSFRILNTVDRRSQANDGRRAIRQRVTSCLQTHWNDRNTNRPSLCQDADRINMSQYPFESMFEEIRQDICGANRDQLRVNVDVELFIRGERGCLERDEERGVVDPAAYVVIASNFRLNCPIPEGGGWEMGGAPATPPLPNIRLPGRDIPPPREVSNDWKECWRLCEATDECGAWTFRAPGTWPGTASAVCLLKTGAGVHVPDACCQSGIKE
ncbi:MAG: hypothetical protein GY798_01060 [Hyphomicrobiales bacterium]|nr:hypothetical protein [Hyphomicrobiales bacterium]